MPPTPPRHLLAALTLLLGQAALAQATLIKDGEMRAAIGLGASLASGNSRAGNLNLTVDVVRATETDKVSLYGRVQYARSNGNTTDEQGRTGLRYDHDISSKTFTYVGGDLERNRLGNLKGRAQIGGGLGYHWIREEDLSFDVFGGLSYTDDRYIAPALIDGSVRSRFDYPSLMLGEESTHKVSDTTRFKQKLTLLPNLHSRGEYRANLDADIAVAINKTMSLTVGVAIQHNSEPSPGRKSTDSLLTTGIAMKFD
jgi:putative salt-induced outer membrane protein